MRFGLCTALLGDGFFSYEVSGRGHGALGLLWFDEYDNAGQGRGYLGQPLGPAQRAITSLTTVNEVLGGGFNSQSDFGHWHLAVANECSATAALDTTDPAEGSSSVRVDVTAGSVHDYGISLYTLPVGIQANSDYTLSFSAKADEPCTVDAWIAGSSGGRPVCFASSSLTTAWSRYQVTAHSSESDTSALLYLGLGRTSGAVWIDDVHLQAGNCNVWRRDFEGGLSLVNASTSSATIPLGGVFRHIRGTQAPGVNNGALVARVTLPGHDGLILIRPLGTAQSVAALATAQLAGQWLRTATKCRNLRGVFGHAAHISAGTRRVRAVQSEALWASALARTRVVLARIGTCRALVAQGDGPSALSQLSLVQSAARRARLRIARAGRGGIGYRAQSRGAGQAAAAGCDMIYTAWVALGAM